MKKGLLFLLIMSASVFVGCRDWGIMGIRGNGKIVTENREISDFTELELRGAYNVEIKVGDEPGVVIKCEQNLIKYIRTRHDGDKLIIDNRKSISPRKEIKILITTPNLYYLEASSACDIYAENISGEKFILDLSGASSVELNGKVDKFEVDASGASSLEAKNLKANRVSISLSGAGSADVYAGDYLNADVSGVGSITYYGNPRNVKKDISGIGSISKK